MKINIKTISIFLFLFVGFIDIVEAQDNNWDAPKSANDMKNPFAGDVSAISQGKKMYNQMCAICHGRKGDGKGVGGVSLSPKPTNFLSLGVRNESDGAIFWKITEGKPPMAAYKELLNEDQRWKLVSYIRELEKN